MDRLARWSPRRGPISPLWTLEGLRAARAVSIAELATRAGVNPSTVIRVLHGDSYGTPRVRRALAAALGVDPDAISWPEPPSGPTLLRGRSDLVTK